MSVNDDDNVDDSDKGERKRQREKQRRSDLASAFEDLQAILNIIDPSNDMYNKSELDVGIPVTRLDLIRKSSEALRRIHQENLELRRLVTAYKSGDYGDGEVSKGPLQSGVYLLLICFNIFSLCTGRQNDDTRKSSSISMGIGASSQLPTGHLLPWLPLPSEQFLSWIPCAGTTSAATTDRPQLRWVRILGFRSSAATRI